MKIGSFAKEFDVSIDTVRYYIDVGLLIPQKDGKNYIFSECDVDDMKLICTFRNYKFPINTILKLLSFKHQLNSKDERVNDLMFKALCKRREELAKEIRSLESMLEPLDEEIEKYTPQQHNQLHNGVPLEFISFFRCPVCKNELFLENTYIEKGQIYTGDAVCSSCGHTVKICDGNIIADEQPPTDVDFQGYEWWNSYIGAPLEEIDSKGACLMNAMHKCYSQIEGWMKENADFYSKDRKLILTSEKNSGRFLLYYLVDKPGGPQFLRNSLIVMYVSSALVASSVRQRIASFEMQPKIVFIIGNSYAIPLESKCVDYFFDDNSSFGHYMVYNRFVVDTIRDSGCLSDECEVYGVITPPLIDLINERKPKSIPPLLSDIFSCRSRTYLKTEKMPIYSKYDKYKSGADSYIVYSISDNAGKENKD